ncbi:MAG: UDP-N-acetylenolpyruvoylglucosamine reductase [Candidatus Buchananbacteria bacterium RIFCSPHIGHO2_01_FULL_44_11]|uniref:UDP-N-acetylenolpyruvoylglucosamine reductase n=1 Tax=Candidatus Buchananbacteria bacterium RIFCSPHIGHO2_01_FULL_44_11 TaxID=1797535 RepID=A0A1G1Y0K4_9BACT|nr:MAG: UDP-N-acetylenolpyruvoylglucosamine reductase [Candidatus Buchananbacteria bacterium RIFCSPHIGHO2_01_FULL_44_11]
MIDKLRQSLGEQVKENEILANYVTFKIGGPARYFYAAKTKADLVKAIAAAQELKLDYFILGGGSNLLVSDQGFNGLVIKQDNIDFKIDGTTVYAQAGALVTDVLRATLEAGLIGWAWAAGLPGTIGGAVRGNAGAYGQGMSNILKSAEIYYQAKVQIYTNEQMGFSYRHSLAKGQPIIILSVVLELQKGDTVKDLAQVKKYEQYRSDTQPQDLPNAGCIFKNIDLSTVEVNKARVIKALDVTEAEYDEKTKFGKLPVSFIFDRLNLKGKTMGGAQVSEKHGAFIVNIGQARADQVIMLMSDLKMRVRNQLGIQLQEEVQFIGF